METSPLQSFHRVLIIKPGAVGDLLQMTPLIRSLKRTYGDAEITLLVGHASSIALFRHHPSVTSILVFDRTGAHRSLAAQLSFLRELRRRNFDLVLNFQRSNLRTWFFVLATFPRRVLVYHKARNRVVHAVINYLETLAPLGIDTNDRHLEFHPGDDADRFARDLFAQHGLEDGPVIALNPGATHAVNRWPAERFAELADRIHDALPARVLVVGGPDDAALADEIVDRSRTRPISLAGSTTLLQLGAVLKRCSLLVSGDTGPLHMATAVNTPVIALFGAADPARTGPIGPGHRVIQATTVRCVPCRSRQCANVIYLECMLQITAERVLGELKELLATKTGL